MLNTLKRTITIFGISVLLTGMLFLSVGCDEDDDTSLWPFLLLLNDSSSGSGDERSNDAIARIPEVLTNTDPSTSSGLDRFHGKMNRNIIEDEDARVILQGAFYYVRNAIEVGSVLTDFGGELITGVEEIESSYGVAFLDLPISFTDEVDTEYPGRVALISKSTTFGSNGRKLEIWYGDNAEYGVRQGVKILELDYARGDNDTIDGVFYFRFTPDDSYAPDDWSLENNGFSMARLEFSKAVSGNGFKRTALVHVENNPDENGQSGNASFFIEEDEDGVVSVDGAYSNVGEHMPIADNESNINYTTNSNRNDTLNWAYNTEHAYLFSAAGSDEMGKGVVNVIFPARTGDNQLTGSETTPYGNGQPFTTGEIYTDGLLLSFDNEPVDDCGTATDLLECLNLVLDAQGSSIDLTVNSSQSHLNTALSDILTWAEDNGVEDVAWIKSIQGVANIKNPAYFFRDDVSNELIGQENTDDLETFITDGTVEEYETLEAKLRITLRGNDGEEEGGVFTPDGVFSIDIVTGTGITPLDGHTKIDGSWEGANDAVPSNAISVD